MLDFFTLQTASSVPTVMTVFYTLILAIVLSTAIGITYVKTFKGLSYSKNYVQALILSSVVAAIIMQSIGDSLARGLGMIGALAIIRFRTNFKDPRDIIFMFAALSAGISSGVYSYAVGVFGTIMFCALSFVLYYSPVGQAGFFDGMLRFNVSVNSKDKVHIEKYLKEHCRHFALITLREMAQGLRFDYAYHVKLKDVKNRASLLESLRTVDTIEGVSLMLQESTIEL
ncbi:DUF4956 domain-containing protein [Chitinispirillales bacterium ANBcel5]|uniref:DUF4956 domain-containing protein n=1 Tax=Cellulosispirillum alkaliphilum TaxID=3039283 RepID=UPI002A54ADB6|nr:DUF4956 domain-containing protein [Chitinispirillales bacterium ANBcel5]